MTNPQTNQIIGKKIREIRLNYKITREALAEKINVSTRFLADVESGKVGISISTLINLCNNLGVSSDYILGLINSDNYSKIETKLNRVGEEYMPYLETLIDTFIATIDLKFN